MNVESMNFGSPQKMRVALLSQQYLLLLFADAKQVEYILHARRIQTCRRLHLYLGLCVERDSETSDAHHWQVVCAVANRDCLL
jgi:hypothetical protein